MATITYTYISGTFNGLTFYVVNGRQMVRTKTSINKKRFYADPAFARLRQYSAWLQIASPIASKIYRQLPPQKGLQQQITGQLMQWLKKGVALAVAVQRLIDAYLPKPKTVDSIPAVGDATVVDVDAHQMFRHTDSNASLQVLNGLPLRTGYTGRQYLTTI